MSSNKKITNSYSGFSDKEHKPTLETSECKHLSVRTRPYRHRSQYFPIHEESGTEYYCKDCGCVLRREAERFKDGY